MGSLCCKEIPPVEIDAETESTCCNGITCNDQCPSTCCIITINENLFRKFSRAKSKVFEENFKERKLTK